MFTDCCYCWESKKTELMMEGLQRGGSWTGERKSSPQVELHLTKMGFRETVGCQVFEHWQCSSLPWGASKILHHSLTP